MGIWGGERIDWSRGGMLSGSSRPNYRSLHIMEPGERLQRAGKQSSRRNWKAESRGVELGSSVVGSGQEGRRQWADLRGSRISVNGEEWIS